MTPTARHDALGFAVTASLAAAGGALFDALGFPAPFLTGPAVAVTVAALLGTPVHVPAPVRHSGYLALGLGIGAGVTPEVVSSMAEWPLSLVALTLSLAVTQVGGTLLLERGFGFARASAVLAATPGHLSYVIGYATDREMDVARISVVQAIRVLLLTLVVPPLLLFWGEPGEAALGAGATMSPGTLLALAGMGALAGFGLLRLRVPAAFLLAGMAVSAVGHATGATPGAMPAWIVIAAFMLLGALVGTRFGGIPATVLLHALWAGVAVTALASAVAIVAALAVAAAIGLAPTLLIVAYAPGGVEAMAAIAVQLGLAPAFVAAHHVARLLVLTLLVPLLLARDATRG